MKEKQIKVSIIVPFYNAELYLDNCLESLINQTYKNIEIILVDDGSTDNSKAICEKYLSSNIKYIYKKNGGVSSARNLGIKESSSEYIMFVDADDTIEIDAISSIVNSYENEKTLVGLTVRNNVDYKNNKKIIRKIDSKKYISNILYNKANGFCVGYLFNKSYIKEFDEKSTYMEDALFLISYLKNVENVQVINSYYNYLINNDSVTRRTTISKITKNILNVSYTLNQINNLLEEINLIKDYHEAILEKKAKIIESECAKINSGLELCKLMDNKDIKKIITELSITTKNKRNKFFYKMLTNKNKSMLNIYLLSRKTLKKILGRV